MADYKVNLPKTNFPMRADLAKREPQFLAFWQKIDIYQKICKQNCHINQSVKKEAVENFTLHDGPPYANGEIHLGHAVNKIFKDIIMKSRMLDGYATPYVPGWDCHGLPIELNVEKKHGRAGDKITKEEFIAKCREYAASQVDVQREAFKRLGVFGDWENPYLTMKPSYEANIIRALGEIIENGYVGRGFKPVHWCTACGSALAEAEVEYQDKESPAIDVRFRFVDSEKFFQEKFGLENIKNASIPIWTTTPWTLPANEAVCLNAELEYVLVECRVVLDGVEGELEQLLIAKELLESVMQRYGVKDYRVIANFIGEQFDEARLEPPVIKTDKRQYVPVIFGKHVTVDAGTGAVHTAPMHGLDDFKACYDKNNVDKLGNMLLCMVDAFGRFGGWCSNLPDLINGKKVFDANPDIIEYLRKDGILIQEEKITHSYPHCWRHKKPLIFLATRQWFAFMDKPGVHGKSLRQMALEEIETVKWLAPHGKERIKEMVGNRPDWCISRQRVWGTPIALFVHMSSGESRDEMHPQWHELLKIVANGVEQEGIEFWQKLNKDEFLKQHAPEYPSEDYTKVTDTLDVWFDSGVSHYCVAKEHAELHFPADLYIEGSDQYRGWFQSSLLTSLAINGKAPYKQVVSHGFTVDGAGKKMSKSLGNVILPQKVTDTLGADILRLWAASIYMYEDLPVSDEILARNIDTYRLIRNTARFLLGNLAGFDPTKDLVARNELLQFDRTTVINIFYTQNVVSNLYKTNDFPYVFRSVISAHLTDLSNFYFSIIKDRLYTMPESSHGRRSAQTALYYVLEILVRCIAPVLSFTAEEIWQEMRAMWPTQERVESIFLSEYISSDPNNALLNQQCWSSYLPESPPGIADAVNEEIEKHRAAGEIGSSLEAEVVLYCGDEFAELRKLAEKDELRFVFITSAAIIRPLSERDEKAVATDDPELWITVTKSPHQKCPRCWHRRDDIGKNPEYPEVCMRCAGNLSDSEDSGKCETRKYA
ncbi:MAG: isoleucine--tRNA ligase [Gammaproteobacteria bacterium GWE2_37_16]|nr:MAG: isoleucine--tRNA ligase [Gammaproteobacteria bacterium GWE2_37_16]